MKSATGAPGSGARCPVCGDARGFGPGWKVSAEGASYDIVFCQVCGLGRTEPFPDEASLRKLYSTGYREDDSTRFPAPVEKAVWLLRAGRVRAVERFSRKGRLLDVGCGRGDFPRSMAGRGWEAAGLEVDERVRSRGSSPGGVDIRYGTVEDAPYPDRHFDVVSFWHVFEHLRDPERALSAASRLLKTGGLLVVAVPNAGSLQAKLTRGSWFHLDPPFHLYHYSAGNLGRLLEASGFKVVEVRQFSLEYGPYGFLQSLLNLTGLRRNRLYDFLRGDFKGIGGVVLSILLLPILAPVSLALSLLEASIGRGGSIEVYALKK